MKEIKTELPDIYSSNTYLKQNPSLHIEDSSWKVSKIIPYVDCVVAALNEAEINVLDVGGGQGLILAEVCRYIVEIHRIKVNKFAIDLSPDILKIQKETNPDIKEIFNENICKTSLPDKKIDITLMIDVLEHIPDSYQALQEVRRISKFVIFKIPLEENLFNWFLDLIKGGKLKVWRMKQLGHIHSYTCRTIKRELEKYTGKILKQSYTNVFEYLLTAPFYTKNMSFGHRFMNALGWLCFHISPQWTSVIFSDFTMLLVKCYNDSSFMGGNRKIKES